MAKIFGSFARPEDTTPEAFAEAGWQEGEGGSFTKIIRAAPAPAQIKQTVPSLAEPVSSSISSNLETAVSSLMAEKDTNKIISGLSALEGSVAVEQAKMRKEAELRATAEYGLPALEQEYKKIKNFERSNPYYFQKYGDMDSDEAIAAKSKIQSAMNAARASVTEKLATDASYVGLSARMDVAKRAIAAKLSLNLNSDERKDLEAENFVSNLGQEGQKNLTSVMPAEFAADPRKALAYVKGKDTKTQAAILDAVKTAPEEMPSLALRGNPFARKILQDREVEALGSAAKTLLQEGYDIADRSVKAAEAFATLSKVEGHPFSTIQPKERQQFLTLLGPQGLDLSENKEQHEKGAASLRQQIAKEYMKYKNITDFNSDVTKILAPKEKLPLFLQTALLKEPKIDIARAKQLAREAPTAEAAQTQLNELHAWYSDAVKARNKSALFSIDPWEADKIKTEAAMGRLEKFFQGAGLPGLSELVKEVPPLLSYEQQVGFPSSGSSPQQLFEYNGEMLTRQEYERRKGADYYKGVR